MKYHGIINLDPVYHGNIILFDERAVIVLPEPPVELSFSCQLTVIDTITNVDGNILRFLKEGGEDLEYGEPDLSSEISSSGFPLSHQC
jgi:hypothetical protein